MVSDHTLGNAPITERTQLEAAITSLESQRAILGDVAVDAAVAGLKQKLALLTEQASVPPMTGERKFVTVVFADLSGFTAISERMDPEAVRDLMNRCFDALVPVISKYGGTVDKFIGDGIMALFGAPVIHENDAERALRATLELLQELEAFNRANGTNLGMHAGINSGLVLAGGLGSSERQEYSVVGDPVNVAARLESISDRGEIFVGADTYRLTEPLFDFEPLAPIQVKGKAEPLAVYQLLGAREAPGPLRGIAGLRSPLVGRERELARFHELVAGLRRGTGAVMALVGEAGLGKSRLVAEVRQSEADGMRWVEGRALSYTTGMSYWMAGNLLRALIGADDTMDQAAVGEQLLVQLQVLLPGQGSDLYPYLARMLDVPLEGETADRVRYLTPQALQAGIQRAIIALVHAAAQAEPLVLVWEDFHWGDWSSFQILESLLPLADEVPLLLCLNFRPYKENPAWDFHERIQERLGPRYHVLEIEPLSPGDSNRLVENLLRIENMPSETLALILNKAEGNPFFLEELLRSLLDAGLVILEGERAVAQAEIHAVEVPDTLQGVIAERIDRLLPEDKQTLQTAAVIGRVFQRRVLRALQTQQQTPTTLEVALAELNFRELIRPFAAGQTGMEYIFKHAVTQDVAYGSLLMVRRRLLHGLAAEAIEALFPANLDELAPTLAYHYQQADRPAEAIPYLQKAGDRAAATYANQEAIAYYRAALEALERLPAGEHAEGMPRALTLRETLALVLQRVGAYEEARAVLESAMARLPAGAAIEQARLLRHVGDSWSTQREWGRALDAFQQAIALLIPEPVAPEQAWWETWLDIELARAWAIYGTAEGDELSLLLERLRPAVEAHGTISQKVKFNNMMALMHLRASRWYMVPDEALHYAEQVAEYGEPAALLYGGTLFTGLFTIGFIHLWREELAQAEAKLGEALRVAEETGATGSQLMATTYLGLAHRMRGAQEQVALYARRSFELAEKEGNLVYLAMAQGNQAWLAWQAGDLAGVRNSAEQALQALQKVNFPILHVAAFPLLALALADDDLHHAVTLAGDIIAPHRKRLPDQITDALAAAVRSWQDGDQPGARSHLEQAQRLALETGYF